MTCRFPKCFRLVVPRWKFPSTNQKHYPDLGSMEFLRLFLRGHFALKPLVVSRNVGCFLRHSCWPRERKRTIWIRYCHLNVLVFFSSHFALLLRTDDEGSEETMDTESQQKSTLSNDVYKQASLDFSSLFCFFPFYLQKA